MNIITCFLFAITNMNVFYLQENTYLNRVILNSDYRVVKHSNT